jgi:hypothetical protein
VQAGFILDGFARDEVLFGVAQKGSVRCIKKSAAERLAADDSR